MYVTEAPKWIDAGFAVTPIMPRSKKPATRIRGAWVLRDDWPTDPVIDPRLGPLEQERSRGGGLGLILGPRSRDVIRVDIDNPAFEKGLLEVLPWTPVRNRGQRGQGLFYRCQGAETKKFLIGDKLVCEILAEGRQTLLPPSIHPDTGKPYIWTGESLLTAEPASVGYLDLVARIIGVLTPHGYRQETPKGPATGLVEGDPWREINATALANLDAWVPRLGLQDCVRMADGRYSAVPSFRPSPTGRVGRDRSLGISPSGIKDFGEDKGYTPVDLVMAVLKMPGPGGAFCWLDERLGISAGAPTISLPEPTVLAPPKEPPKPRDLVGLTWNQPGLLGDCIEWYLAGARRPNRVLALSCALGVLGTLVGRRVLGPTALATHNFIVAVGESGAGKQHVVDSARRLMTAAGASMHLGPGEFISMPAVIAALLRSPLMLCVQDEFGSFLQRVTSGRASGWEVTVTKTLRSIFTVNDNVYPTPEWAQKASVLVNWPAVSLLGLTTPEEFYSSLHGEVLKNGFVGRLLVLHTTESPSATSVDLEKLEVPADLTASLRKYHQWSGPESLLQLNDITTQFKPDVIRWGLNAEDLFTAFEDKVKIHREEHPEVKDFMPRCAELALRVATVRACAAGQRRVNVDDMQWGIDLVWGCANTLVEQGINTVAANERTRMFDRIKMFILTKDEPVSRRDLQRYIGGGHKRGEINDVMSQLEEAGYIERYGNSAWKKGV